MKRYVKRPVIVEASMFHSKGNIPEGVKCDTSFNPPLYYIDTLEGRMKVSEGDWIITGVDGEKYPCKPDIFEKTYELVEK